MKALALSKLSKPSLRDLIVLGRECGIESRLTEAVQTLVSRWELVDESMQDVLGWSAYLSIANMREKLWRAAVEKISNFSPTTVPTMQSGLFGSPSKMKQNKALVSYDTPCFGLSRAKEL